MKHSPQPAFRSLSCRGYSLIELLVTISIIGAIVGLAIPKLANISDEAKTTTAKRNAQNLASLSASLSVLNVEHVIPESLGGKEATCRLLRHGIVVPDGAMAGTFFGMPGLDEDEIPPSAVYLEVAFSGFSALRLEYDDEGEGK